LKVDDTMLRYTLETVLAAAALTLTAYAWFIDPVANQRALGAIIGSALVIFAMMVYTYYTPTFTGRSNSWLLLGCLAGAVFLLIAVQVSS
jgi:RsiW-degrading membrane proteinase PrsW (M82 family)